MNWWNNQSIQFKINAGIGLILLPVLAAVILIITNYVQGELWRREVQAAENLNAIASIMVSDAMMEGQSEKVQEAITMLGENVDGQFDSIAIYDHQSVLTSYATGFPGGRTINKELYEVDTSDSTCWVCHQLPNEQRPAMTVVSIDGQDVLRSVVPLYNEPRCQACHGTELKVLGDSIVDLRLNPFQRTSQTVALSLGGSVLAAAALFALTMFQFTRRVIISPIGKLVEASKKITEGDFNRRVDVNSKDEIGVLGNAFNDMATQVSRFVHSLEELVAERTDELEQANQRISRRAELFQSIAQISRSTSSIQNQEELLLGITHLISQHFGFYHVGIFLLDINKKYAVLRAANSDGGQRMLKRGHRLEIGQTGIVGFVTSTGDPRVALDTGADAVYFDNPDLPDTRSEMALPLKIRGEVIGALDVQSTQPNAFSQDDITILSTLASQVSAALENTLLHEEAQEALTKAEVAYRQLTRKSWTDIHRFTSISGYRFDGNKAEPLNGAGYGGQIETQKDAFVIPVQLRGESIGKIYIKSATEDSDWTEDEIAIIEATAERVAIALENARLFEETSQRAERERMVSDITLKIRSTNDPDTMIATALEELKQALRATKVQLLPHTLKNGKTTQQSVVPTPQPDNEPSRGNLE